MVYTNRKKIVYGVVIAGLQEQSSGRQLFLCSFMRCDCRGSQILLKYGCSGQMKSICEDIIWMKLREPLRK